MLYGLKVSGPSLAALNAVQLELLSTINRPHFLNPFVTSWSAGEGRKCSASAEDFASETQPDVRSRLRYQPHNIYYVRHHLLQLPHEYSNSRVWSFLGYLGPHLQRSSNLWSVRRYGRKQLCLSYYIGHCYNIMHLLTHI